MNLTLNIGLARKGRSNISVWQVLREVQGHEIFDLTHLVSFRVAISNTEATLVVSGVKNTMIEPAFELRVLLHNISSLTGQDCIAWTLEEPYGEHAVLHRDRDLTGPRAYDWLPFNPDYFISI